jgi:hypothetical protein
MDKKELQERITNAIVLLTDGHPFKVGDLTFKSQKDCFSVTGWTLKNDLKNVTKKTALTELKETKDLFNKMCLAAPELSDFIVGKEIEYHLCFDVGKGGIGICSETDGGIKWVTELKE